MQNWKKYIPHGIIFMVFILASMIYFWPAVQGQVIYAVDNINGTSAVQDGWNYHYATGDYTYWTQSMFAGMPNYQVGGHGGFLVDHILQPVRQFFSWGNRNHFFVFLFYLCVFFLLLRAFKINEWLSMAGAFAMALSSYFFIIVAAQHMSKVYTITWLMPVIIGFILTFRKQYAWGALLIMFFSYLSFFQHPQMTLYFGMLIGVFYLAEVAIAVQNKEWKHFAIASLVALFSAGIGIGMGSANMLANQEYAKETMRGGHSDLAKANDTTNKTKGLDLDYATAWSYGINETMTFLIPNFMGGASGYDLGTKGEPIVQEMVKEGFPRASAVNFTKNAPTYWGDKPFTSGPVYMGAVICFLFLLGLIIVPGAYKWALLIATLFSVFLAWGRHFMPLTELFFNYFPMYNKFRAVESILVVAEVTMPLLALLGVQRLTEQRNKPIVLPFGWKVEHAILAAGGITAGICLIFALFGGSICDFTSSYDAQWKGQVGGKVYQLFIDQRSAMLKADAWRSFLFVAAGCALVWFYQRKPFKTMYLGLALTALIVADMWQVDKRFCNDGMFVSPTKRDKAFAMQPYEKQILDDKDYFRVFNLTANTFNDARTSYYLNSIGGYSAAKLRRYQDLIDEHLSKMHWPVINMLNTRYIISKGKDGQPFPYYNPDALGAAWLVDSLVCVNNANAESDALNTLDLRHIAVADTTLPANRDLAKIRLYRSDKSDKSDPSAVSDAITLLSHSSKQLVYHTSVWQDRLAVLSEIYYPYGWKATIDGEDAPIYRVNYTLRALHIPAGEHEIMLTFAPDSVRTGNRIALTCFIIFILLTIVIIGGKIYLRRKRITNK